MDTQQISDSHDVITVVGAHENTLKNVSVQIPKRRLTVFTGVSGSGKSSLVFDTIAAESQRLINETYPAFIQGFMPNVDRPSVERIDGLTPAIVVSQERMGGNPRSTVGTATDATALLRLLFARIAEPNIGGPGAYSFNVPTVSASGAMTAQRGDKTIAEKVTFSRTGGMCPRCEGMGDVTDIDLDQILDEGSSLDDGAITVPGYTAGGWNHRLYASSGLFPSDKPVSSFTKRQRHDLLYKDATRMKIEGITMTYEGLIPRIQKSMLSKDREAMQPHIRAFVDRAVTYQTCPECDGTRLSADARSALIKGVHIGQLCDLQLDELARWLDDLADDRVEPLVGTLRELLKSFADIGLSYLSLNRPAGTLSGGEAQRTKIVRHLGSSLTDVTYVFDEPTAGLHPADIERMNSVLLQLRDKGNTVLVVTHQPEVIAIADHCVELGPEGGASGGKVCFEGSVTGLKDSDTATGRHLHDGVELRERVRSATSAYEVREARGHNLRGVDVDIPLGVLVAVTGVSGSGKSTLLEAAFASSDDAVIIDQSPIRGSRRSNPASYSGALEPLRKAFAKAHGVKPGLFSSNSDGACPACKGNGVIFTDLTIMSSVATTCEECQGLRFKPEVLEYELGGANIAQVLALTVTDSLAWAQALTPRVPAAVKILENLRRVGLGYITLGQNLSTLSGGERQRLLLASRIGDSGSIIVLDEPSSGLHLADIDTLLTVLDDLVDSGMSVVVIEHSPAVVAHADWIIDVGPGAGSEGGGIVFTGTPQQAIAAAANPKSRSQTARHLARIHAGARVGEHAQTPALTQSGGAF